MKLNSYPLLLTASVATLSSAASFDPTNRESVTSAAKQLASGLFSYYEPTYGLGVFPKSLWWQAGAAWDALVNYWFLTGDDTYNSDAQSALLAQGFEGFQPLNQTASMTNDEIAIWALAGVTAAERSFPSNGTNYIDLSIASFENLLARWDDSNSTQSTCGVPAGGLRMGIWTFSTLYDYKNTLSTALLFQLSARLARYTGNVTYTDTAVKTYDWLEKAGLIDADGSVFDGLTDYSSSSANSSSEDDCSESVQIDHLQWSHTSAALLQGALIMANITTDSVWRTRSLTLLSGIENVFYPASPNAVPATSTNNNATVLVEAACEPVATCNKEQVSFKGLAARWLAWGAVSAPASMNIPARVADKISGTASAAHQRCNDTLCTGRWFELAEQYDVGDISSFTGLGQQLSAFEAVLAPLVNSSIVLQRSGTTATVNGSAVATLTGTASSTTATGARQTGAATRLSGVAGVQGLALVMAVVVMALAL
ncbi:glycoside hydrolase [Phyllosticta citricarpa]|uniref:Mannan endo-1,6-alpha-mannosidase n=2 Tax=Phyllosticta TaxID=121621 RepID=A0ABR1LPZ1_9PEZI